MEMMIFLFIGQFKFCVFWVVVDMFNGGNRYWCFFIIYIKGIIGCYYIMVRLLMFFDIKYIVLFNVMFFENKLWNVKFFSFIVGFYSSI